MKTGDVSVRDKLSSKTTTGRSFSPAYICTAYLPWIEKWFQIPWLQFACWRMGLSDQWSCEQAQCKSLRSTNSHTFIEVQCSSQRVVEWCSMHKNKTIGFYFYSEASTTGENTKGCFTTMLCARCWTCLHLRFSAGLCSFTFVSWCPKLYGYKTSPWLISYWISNSMAPEGTQFDVFRLLYVEIREGYCIFCGANISIPYRASGWVTDRRYQ